MFAAALTQALNGIYWKPVQAGLDGETDSQIVARLSGAPVLPEIYRFKLAASPHKAAAAEGVAIDPAKLVLPRNRRAADRGRGGRLAGAADRRHALI